MKGRRRPRRGKGTKAKGQRTEAPQVEAARILARAIGQAAALLAGALAPRPDIVADVAAQNGLAARDLEPDSLDCAACHGTGRQVDDVGVGVTCWTCSGSGRRLL